jgi:PKD repeat protein
VLNNSKTLTKMKTTTYSLKTLALGVLMFFTFSGNTQTCTASFVYSLMPNGVVNFYSTSSPVNSITTQYYWNFGNNSSYTATGSSTATSTYSANGVFTVSLFLNTPPNGTCQAVATVTITNTSNNCNLVTDFFITYGGTNGVYVFTNNSSGTVTGTTYTYNFGDGSSSNLANTTHTYFANVPYTVTLLANNNTNPACNGSKTVVNYVTSVAGCNWTPNFSYTVGANGSVNFANTSTGGSYYYWSFGDNSTGTGSTASHTYQQNGTYTVVLTVKTSSINPPPSGTCIKSVTQVITVTTAPCPVNANFSVVPTPTAQYWIAIPASTIGVANAIWSWGDGSSSNGLFSTHQYSAAGIYTLCLTVTVSCGASATSCNSYSIYRSGGDMSMINVNVMSAEDYAALFTGIKDVTAGPLFIGIYPNPNKGLFELRANAAVNQPVKAEVFNIIGEKVFTGSIDLSSQTGNVDVGELPSGVYIIRLDDTVRKFVIEK